MSTGGGFFDVHQRVTRRPSTPRPVGPLPAALSVSQLTQQIEGVVRGGFPTAVQVRGEVSNWRPNAGSGHCYFTLKDDRAVLSCVMFRGEASRLKFQPRDGIETLAAGRVGVYGPQGKYQLQVESLDPLGQGALELAFKQLRQKLELEGLFSPERKRLIPAYPMRVTLITSREAAALQDMLKVLRRFPWLQLSLYAVPVQGDGAAAKIAAAIAHAGRLNRAEVILLARGGGSLEDLSQFSQEIVARAVANSIIPVVTGIGHEVDVSIADLVADHHAHTPTEAAQTIVARWRSVAEELDDWASRLRRGLRAIVADAGHRLNAVERHEAFRRPMDRVDGYRQLLDDRQRQLTHAIAERIRLGERNVATAKTRLDANRPQRILARLREKLDALGRKLQAHDPRHRAAIERVKLTSIEGRLRRASLNAHRRRLDRVASIEHQLHALSPDSVLRRGFSLTTLKKSGVVVRDPAQLKAGDRLVTRLAGGSVESTVDDARQLPLFD